MGHQGLQSQQQFKFGGFRLDTFLRIIALLKNTICAGTVWKYPAYYIVYLGICSILDLDPSMITYTDIKNVLEKLTKSCQTNQQSLTFETEKWYKSRDNIKQLLQEILSEICITGQYSLSKIPYLYFHMCYYILFFRQKQTL